MVSEAFRSVEELFFTCFFSEGLSFSITRALGTFSTEVSTSIRLSRSCSNPKRASSLDAAVATPCRVREVLTQYPRLAVWLVQLTSSKPHPPRILPVTASVIAKWYSLCCSQREKGLSFQSTSVPLQLNTLGGATVGGGILLKLTPAQLQNTD